MAERDVVEAVERGAVDLSHAADHGFRAAADGLRAAGGHILVCDEHVADGEVDILRGKEPANGGIVVPDALVLQHLRRQRGKDVRHQPEGDGAVPVRQRHAVQLPG